MGISRDDGCRGLMWICDQVIASIEDLISPRTPIPRQIVMKLVLTREVIASVILPFFLSVRKVLVILGSST